MIALQPAREAGAPPEPAPLHPLGRAVDLSAKKQQQLSLLQM
jgi:hypothetical protein